MRPKRSRLRTVSGWAVPPTDTSSAYVAPKQADEIYHTADYRVWRERVIERAGYRCEALEGDVRCDRRAPEWQLYADHIKEVKDGGAEFDLGNGQCLCARHHTLKTNSERDKRLLA